MTTFNDLMTLLMVFFVLLFSLSSLDTMKLQSFRICIRMRVEKLLARI